MSKNVQKIWEEVEAIDASIFEARETLNAARETFTKILADTKEKRRKLLLKIRKAELESKL